MTGRGVYIVLTSCTDPERVDEYRTWYTQTHISDILETPGFVRARFYESRENPEAQFAALYDLESDDIDETLAGWRARLPELQADGRMSELLDRKFTGHFELLVEQSERSD